jgi:molybdopterin synthase catalytic subunit
MFDAAEEAAKLTKNRTDLGAVVTFTGLCRDESGALAALEIEHYPGMAEEEINRVVAQAAAQWPLEGVAVLHRFGLIRPGEPIVLVVTASLHRAEAFEAAAFLMDFLKTQAPFWKKQHPNDACAESEPGSGAAAWVDAKAEDDAAAQKWRG